MFKKQQVGGISVVLALLVGCFVTVSVVLPSSSSPVSAAGSSLQWLKSARLADTRPAPVGATIDGQFVGIGQRPARTITKVQIGGRGGVPVNADAVWINLTSVQPVAPSFLTAYPCDDTQNTSSVPNASNVNSPAGVDRANSSFVELGLDGTICVYNEAASDFVIDVNGFVPFLSSPYSVTPARLLDTRPGQRTVDNLFAGIGRPGAVSVTTVQVAGRGGIPLSATAVVLNLTAEFPSATTYLTAYPCDGAKPDKVSTLNLPSGDTRANSVFVKLSAKGTVCIYTVAETSIIVDVSGFVESGSGPTSVNPVRLADSRPGGETTDGTSVGLGRPGPTSVTTVQVGGRGGVPINATSAFINLTADRSTDGTYLTAYPCDGTRPEPGSNLNLPAFDTGANGVFVRLSSTGTVCVYTVAAVDIIVDVNGYIADAPPATTTCTVNGVSVPTSIPQSECDALVAFFNATGGPKWINKTDWLAPRDPCTWYGITCNGGHVTEIVLESNGLTGALPSQVGNLPSLSRLYLNANKLTGVPTEIGKLTKLTDLTLSNNKLTSLPAAIGNLTNLESLAVDGNQLTSLPAELVKLTKLTGLYVHDNKLSTLPTGIGKLTRLNYLNLSSNQLKSLPAEIGKLTALESLYVYRNQLTALPTEIGSLTKLIYFDCSYNKLSKVPPEISKLSQLRDLSLSNNVMAGDVTTPLLPLKAANKLETLWLSGNKCLTTSNAALKTWLMRLDATWNNGC